MKLTNIQANEQICHDQAQSAVNTYYDLLLEPELSPYLRALINATLALCATDRKIGDRRRFIEEAKRGLEVCKGLHRSNKAEENIRLLEDTIEGAVIEVDDAEQEAEGSGEEGVEEQTVQAVCHHCQLLPASELRQRGAEGFHCQRSIADIFKVVDDVQESKLTSKASTTTSESALGPFPVSSHKKPAGNYLPTPTVTTSSQCDQGEHGEKPNDGHRGDGIDNGSSSV
jgi:hypothetical protein